MNTAPPYLSCRFPRHFHLHRATAFRGKKTTTFHLSSTRLQQQGETALKPAKASRELDQLGVFKALLTHLSKTEFSTSHCYYSHFNF